MPRRKKRPERVPTCYCEVVSKVDNEIRASGCSCTKAIGIKPWKLIIKPEEYFEVK